MADETKSSVLREQVVSVVLLALASFVLAQLAMHLFGTAAHDVAWWPASALAVAALARVGISSWPSLCFGLLIGLLLSDAVSGAPLHATLGYPVASLAVCLVAARVLQRSGSGAPSAPAVTPSIGARRIAVASLSAAAAGAVVMAVAAQIELGSAWSPAYRFGVEQFLGLLILLPITLDLASMRHILAKIADEREWGAQFASSLLVSLVAFAVHTDLPVWLALAFPAAWGASRLGLARTAVSLSAVAAVIATMTVHADGPLSNVVDPTHRLLALQLLIATLAGLTYVLAMTGQRSEREREDGRRRLATLSEMLDTARVGSWSWDVDADIVTWSRQYYEIAGVDAASFEPSFSGLEKLVHPEDWSQLSGAIRMTLVSGTPHEVEYRITRRNGELRIVNDRIKVAPHPRARISRVVGVSRDVTDARTAVVELARQHAAFTALLDAMVEHLVIGVDLAGRITSYNLGAQKLLGYRADEVLGRQAEDLNDPDELSIRAMEFGLNPDGPVLTHSLGAHKDSDTRDWTFLTRDRRRVRISLTVSLMHDAEGQRRGFVAVGTQAVPTAPVVAIAAPVVAAAQEDRFEEFRTAFRAVPVPMAMLELLVGAAGRLHTANEAMGALLGRAESGVDGLGLDSIMHPEDAAAVGATVRALLASGATRSERERCRLGRPDGTVATADVEISVVTADGQPSFALIVAHPVAAIAPPSSTYVQSPGFSGLIDAIELEEAFAQPELDPRPVLTAVSNVVTLPLKVAVESTQPHVSSTLATHTIATASGTEEQSPRNGEEAVASKESSAHSVVTKQTQRSNHAQTKRIAADKVVADKVVAEKAPARQASAKTVPAKTVAAKSVPAKTLPAKTLPAKSVPAARAVVRQAIVKLATVEKTAATPAAVKPAAVTPVAVTPVAAKKAATKPARVKIVPVKKSTAASATSQLAAVATRAKTLPSISNSPKDSPTRVKSSQTRIAGTTPAKTTPAKKAVSNAVLTKSVPSKAVPAKTVPSKTTPAKTVPSKAVPSKAVPTKSVPSKAVPAKTVPNKAVPSKAAPGTTGVSKTVSSRSVQPVAAKKAAARPSTRAKRGLTPISEIAAPTKRAAARATTREYPSGRKPASLELGRTAN